VSFAFRQARTHFQVFSATPPTKRAAKIPKFRQKGCSEGEFSLFLEPEFTETRRQVGFAKLRPLIAPNPGSDGLHNENINKMFDFVWF
jgi:hypothetical protein